MSIRKQTLFACYMLLASSTLLMQFAIAEEKELTGEQLFNKDWSADEKSKKLLGPLFNGKSCKSCHENGRGADNKHNVQIMTLVKKKRSKKLRQDAIDRLKRDIIDLNPSWGELIPSQKSFILHRQGTDELYADLRLQTLGMKLSNAVTNAKQKNYQRYAKRRERMNRDIPVKKIKSFPNFDLFVSERNSPALFGAGLVDSIPPQDIRKIAKKQAATDDGIQGEVVELIDDKVGKFGWRGSISSLREFVSLACANELGLQTKDHQQATDPFDLVRKKPDPEISERQVDDLTSFVANLSAPKTNLPEDTKRLEFINLGKRLFNKVECAKCHVEDVGNVRGVFSDFLLHKMGEQLSDPVAATKKVKRVQVGGGAWGIGISTILEDVPVASLQSWKTPPLWGVADSAPYLHDGRAKTLLEAIDWHDGEAANSRLHFARLSRLEQQALIAFLESLVEPSSAKPIVGFGRGWGF